MLWPDLSEHGLTVFAKSPTSVVVMPIDPDGSLEELEDIPGIVNESENSKTLDVIPNAQFWADRFQAARFRWVPANRVLREEGSPQRALWYWKVDEDKTKDALSKLGLEDESQFPDGVSIYMASETAATRVHSNVSRVNADEVEVLGINPAARRILYGRALSEAGLGPIVLPEHRIHQPIDEPLDPMETRAPVLPEEAELPESVTDEVPGEDEGDVPESEQESTDEETMSAGEEGEATTKTRREDYGRYIPMARKMMFSVSGLDKDDDDSRKLARKMLTTRLSRNSLWPESDIMALANNPEVSTSSLLLTIAMRESMATSYSILIPVRSRRRSGYKHMNAEAILAGGISWATNTLKIKQLVEESARTNDLLIDGLPWTSLARAAFDERDVIFGETIAKQSANPRDMGDPVEFSRRLSRLSGNLIDRPYSNTCDYATEILHHVPKTTDGLIDLDEIMSMSSNMDRDDLMRMAHEYAETMDLQDRYGVRAHVHGLTAIYINAAIHAQTLIRKLGSHELAKQYADEFPSLPIVEVGNKHSELLKAMRKSKADPTLENIEAEKKALAGYLAVASTITMSIKPTMSLAEKILSDVAREKGMTADELIRAELVEPYKPKTRSKKAEAVTDPDAEAPGADAEAVATEGKAVNPYSVGEMPMSLPEEADLQRDSTIDWRKGEPATEEAICSRFGFSGIQYGNYVNQKERQSMLNDCYDALADMAYALDLPDRFMGIDGRLALAFGARGKGGRNAAMAHYEPTLKVINFTKKKGAGTLAHELSHGWDNYFGSLNGVTYLSESVQGSTMDLGMGKFIEAYLRVRADDVSDDWKAYSASITKKTEQLRDMAFIQYTDRMFGDSYLKKCRSKSITDFDVVGWPQRIKPFMDWVRENPSGRMLKGRSYNASDLADLADEKMVEFGQPALSGKEKAFLYRWLADGFSSFKKLHNEVCNTRGSSSVADALHRAKRENLSLFALSGLILDSNKKEKDLYWSTGREYYARAASSVIHQQMTAKGVRNDWAAGISEPSVFGDAMFITSPNIERGFGELDRAHKAFMTHFLPAIQELAVEMVGPRNNPEEKEKQGVDLVN